ncbi:hypothetical protein [Mycolicibacterium thermoresistibile]
MRSRTAAISAVAALVTGCWLTAPALAGAEPTAEPTPEPSHPSTSIEEDGTYAVGTEIVAGTYSSAGPVEGEVCYWKRVSSAEGQPDGGEILENAMSKKPQTVQIDSADGAFVTNGCQPWQQTTAPAGDGVELPPEVEGLLGKAKLRHYIDTLNRNAQQFGQVPGP